MTNLSKTTGPSDVVDWNGNNPVGTICEWYSSDGTIKQLKVETTEYAKLDGNGLAYVKCKIIGLNELQNKEVAILLNQIEPIMKGK